MLTVDDFTKINTNFNNENDKNVKKLKQTTLEFIDKGNNPEQFKNILLRILCDKKLNINYDNIYTFLETSIFQNLEKIKNDSYVISLIIETIVQYDCDSKLIGKIIDKLNDKKLIIKIVFELMKYNRYPEVRKEYFEIIGKLLEREIINFRSILKIKSFPFIHFDKISYELFTRIINSKSEDYFTFLGKKAKYNLMEILMKNNIGEVAKVKVINVLFEDKKEIKFPIEDLEIDELMKQGKNQTIVKPFKIYQYNEEQNIITTKYVVFANLITKKEQKLFEIEFDSYNNKRITYYYNNEILATLVINKNNEMLFDFTRGTYDSQHIRNILNDDYVSLSSFNYELSYLNFADIQRRQYLDKKLNEYSYITLTKDNYKKAEIFNKSLKNPNKTFVLSFCVPGHAAYSLINNGRMIIFNTGGGVVKLYNSIIEIVKASYFLTGNEEIELLYNYIMKLEKKYSKFIHKVFTEENVIIVKKYKQLINFIKNNCTSIDITYCENISQSTGNCVVASAMNLSEILSCCYKTRGEFHSLVPDISVEKNKVIPSDKISETSLILHVANVNNLLKNKEHFKTEQCSLSSKFEHIANSRLTSEENKIINLIFKYAKQLSLSPTDFVNKYIENPDNFQELDNLIDCYSNENKLFAINKKISVLLIFIKNGDVTMIPEFVKESFLVFYSKNKVLSFLEEIKNSLSKDEIINKRFEEEMKKIQEKQKPQTKIILKNNNEKQIKFLGQNININKSNAMERANKNFNDFTSKATHNKKI